MTAREDMLALADEVLAARGFDNALDVRCEVALFEPCEEHVAIRANAAGSKVIYTTASGKDWTFRARDWTFTASHRRNIANLLRARANTGDAS